MSECPLSARELEILELVATGATNEQIARKLVISANTVKVHLRNIYAKMEVESRTEAATLAIKKGWIRVQVSEPAADRTLFSEESESVKATWTPIARWQKILFLAALSTILFVLFLPRSWSMGLPPRDPFSDQPFSSGLAASRMQSSRWVSEAQMLTPRARLAAVSFGGKLYAIGGDTEEGISNAVEEFDPLENVWRRRTSKPTAVANIGAVVVKDKIYIPGGYGADRQAVDVMEVYDPLSDSWSKAAILPEPLFAYAIAAANNKIYVFGGSNGKRYLNTTYIYDPEKDSWQVGTPFAIPRGFLAAQEIEGIIYVVGGYDGMQEYALCEAYDPALEGSKKGPWSPRASMLAKRAGLAVTSVGSSLYVLGGGWQSYFYFNERYDVLNDVWASFETPILGQWRTLAAAAIELEQQVRIYAIGGWSGNYLSTVESYSPFFYISLPSIP